MPHIPVSRRACLVTARAAQTRPQAWGPPAPPGHRSSPPRRCVWLTLPRFRSPIRSASFLLRQQQDLPTKQAAGTHVRSLTRRLERRSSGSLRVNGFGSWAGGRSPCGSCGPAPHPDIPSLLMDSTPLQDHKWKSRHDRDPAHGAVQLLPGEAVTLGARRPVTLRAPHLVPPGRPGPSSGIAWELLERWCGPLPCRQPGDGTAADTQGCVPPGGCGLWCEASPRGGLEETHQKERHRGVEVSIPPQEASPETGS